VQDVFAQEIVDFVLIAEGDIHIQSSPDIDLLAGRYRRENGDGMAKKAEGKGEMTVREAGHLGIKKVAGKGGEATASKVPRIREESEEMKGKKIVREDWREVNVVVSTSVISEVLKGLDFPADKQKCVDYAKRRNAPKEVIEALDRIPFDRLDNLAGVWHAIGEEHKRGQMPGPIPK
jgi:hypothetical protein